MQSATALLIFLYGEETFLVKKKLQEFVAYHQTKYPERVNFFRLSARDITPAIFFDAVRQPSLFSSAVLAGPSKRFIIVEDIALSEDFAEDVASRIQENKEYYVSEKSPVIVLFVEHGSAKKNNPLLVLCEKEGKVSFYPKLDAAQRRSALKSMWQERGMSIGLEALQYFEYCVGEDLWRASNEVEKYSTIKKGRKETAVALQDLKQFLAPPQEVNSFFLIDAFSQKQKRDALASWGKLIAQGSQPVAIVGTLLWQIGNLLLVRAAIDEKRMVQDIAKEFKLHPYVARKTYGQAKYFSLEELKQLYEKVFWLDVEMKRGGVDVMSGFEKIVVGL